jgi:DNA invertase Pin-like site-specific DNA recombinase
MTRSGPPSARLRTAEWDQTTSGISLDDQAETLAEVVAKRGWVHIAHLTDPGLSGRKMTNRKGLLDALARLDRNEADVLVAAKIDRGSHSTTDFARLLDQAEKKGWKLVVLDADVDTTTAAGRLLVDVVSAAASFESVGLGKGPNPSTLSGDLRASELDRHPSSRMRSDFGLPVSTPRVNR